MLEKQPYPWKLRSEELPPALQASASEKLPEAKLTLWLWLGGSLTGLGVLAAFLGWQITLIQAAEEVVLPKLSAEKSLPLQIVPSPTRYTLWAQPAFVENIEQPPSKPTSPINLSPHSEFPAVLLNNQPPSSPTIPINLPLNIPVLPEAPLFSLIGIAQGTDGTVATIKIKEGNSEEIKDVRQGAPILPGYTVMKIADEYVLLKTNKGGKTLRVD